jgi:hypothetical protein
MAALDDRNDVIYLERGELAPAPSAAALLLSKNPFDVFGCEEPSGLSLSRPVSLHDSDGSPFCQLRMPVLPPLDRSSGMLRVLLGPTLHLCTMGRWVFGAALSCPSGLNAWIGREVSRFPGFPAFNAMAGRRPSLAKMSVLARLAGAVTGFASRLGGQPFWYGLHIQYLTPLTEAGQPS